MNSKLNSYKIIVRLFCGLAFIWIQALSAQNAPVTTAGSFTSTGTSVTIPISASVSATTVITSVDLRLNYDPSIATAVSVAKGPSFPGGNLAYSLSTPGLITIGWFTSALAPVSLTGNTVLFNIQFTKAGNGSTTIAFDNNIFSGNACSYGDINSIALNDSPSSSYYFSGTLTFQGNAPKTYAPAITSCPGTSVDIPVTVTDFNTIGSVSLTLHYDPAVLVYTSATNNSAFTELTETVTTAGTIVLGGYPGSGSLSLADHAALATLHFNYLGGSSGLTWYDDGASCKYTGPSPGLQILSNTPLGTFYVDGSVGPVLADWTGAVDNSWENPANWPCGLPTASSSVTIAASAHNPVISSDVVISGLIINPGASVSINPMKSLTVSNTLTNNAGNGGILIKSDETGTGSLRHNTDEVPATIQRFITGSDNIELRKYHQVSVPLMQSENPTSALFMGSYLFSFSESADNWTALGPATNTPLSSNQGYMIYYPDKAITYTFAGKMNNGAFPVPVTYKGAGFNLVPNPYPSAIDWTLVPVKTNLDNAFWIWNEANQNYGAFGSQVGSGTSGTTQYIPVGQSFFVKANASSPLLSLSNAARVNNTQPFLKDSQDVSNRLRLTVNANNASDEILLAFGYEWKNGTDDADVMKMVGNDNAPQLSCFATDGTRLSIDALPLSNDSITIPLNFSLNAATQVSFTASGMESFNGTQPIYLVDRQLNSLVNLRETPVYTFSHDPANDENRFSIRFASVTGIQSQPVTAPGKAFVADKKLYVDVPSMNGQEAAFEVFNATGQLLTSNRITINDRVEMPFAFLPGIYLLRVTSSSQVFLAKILTN